MGSANERRCNNVASSLIGWAHTHTSNLEEYEKFMTFTTCGVLLIYNQNETEKIKTLYIVQTGQQTGGLTAGRIQLNYPSTSQRIRLVNRQWQWQKVSDRASSWDHWYICKIYMNWYRHNKNARNIVTLQSDVSMVNWMNTLDWNLNQNTVFFYLRKCIWKCCLQIYAVLFRHQWVDLKFGQISKD